MRRWIITGIVMAMCSTIQASQNTNIWPSYKHPRSLMSQLNECYTGLLERYTVCGLAVTNVTSPVTNRPNRATVDGFKEDIQTIIPYFWNTNNPISNANTIVYYSMTNIFDVVKIPTNYFDWTPDRGISGIGGYTNDTTVGHAYGFTNEYTVQGGTNFPAGRTNWYTTDYGIQPIRDILEKAQYTTAMGTIDNGVTNTLKVGHVWFNLKYAQQEGGYAATTFDQEVVDDWNYDYSSNINYNVEYEPFGGWPLYWIGAIMDWAREPNDTVINATNYASSDPFDNNIAFWETVTNRTRTGAWDYCYKLTSLGTNTASDWTGGGSVNLAGDTYINALWVTNGNPQIWADSETYLIMGQAAPYQYTVYGENGFHPVSTGYIEFVEEYLGARVDVNKSYNYLYTATNATGSYRPIVTNFDSGRQLYVYGDYPPTYIASTYGDGIVTNMFVWDVEDYLPRLVLTNYFPVGTEEIAGYSEHTNATFVITNDVLPDLDVPFDGDTDAEQKGWGASKAVWTVNWFVTNGFTIQ